MVSEACYSLNFCPSGEGAYEGAGVNCPTSYSRCDHGTHVAGIAAGNRIWASFMFSGVAKNADLISVQVYSWITDHLGSYHSDQIQGLEQVYELRDDFNIAAVNMSLGGSPYTDPDVCDADNVERKQAIDNLRTVGIATVAASGNNSSPNGISAPACISSAVSVGNTTKEDEVRPTSNSSYLLDLLAPGTSIDSSVPGGGYAYKTGTSMAAPHVAGAWAVLKSREPETSVETALSALTSTGVPIYDPRNRITKPRIQVDTAVRVLGAPVNTSRPRPKISGNP